MLIYYIAFGPTDRTDDYFDISAYHPEFFYTREERDQAMADYLKMEETNGLGFTVTEKWYAAHELRGFVGKFTCYETGQYDTPINIVPANR